MATSLARVQQQLAAAPMTSPYPHDLAVAVISDTFRLANIQPPTREVWTQLEDRFRHALWKEQVGMLAHVLLSSSLREDTVKALNTSRSATERLKQFFEDIKPLTAEMVRSNAFRQEEFLRKWLRVLGAPVEGESPKESRARLEHLDYSKTLAEFQKAEEARKKEARAREKALEEAAQREAEARGWRE